MCTAFNPSCVMSGSLHLSPVTVGDALPLPASGHDRDKAGVTASDRAVIPPPSLARHEQGVPLAASARLSPRVTEWSRRRGCPGSAAIGPTIARSRDLPLPDSGTAWMTTTSNFSAVLGTTLPGTNLLSPVPFCFDLLYFVRMHSPPPCTSLFCLAATPPGVYQHVDGLQTGESNRVSSRPRHQGCSSLGGGSILMPYISLCASSRGQD